MSPLPLDGINDYVDISAVVNPWQAAVVIVLIFALLIWPSLSARQSAKRIEKSITENNGGASVKDYLDRLEAKLDQHLEWSDSYVREQDDRLKALEDARPKRRLFRRR